MTSIQKIKRDIERDQEFSLYPIRAQWIAFDA